MHVPNDSDSRIHPSPTCASAPVSGIMRTINTRPAWYWNTHNNKTHTKNKRVRSIGHYTGQNHPPSRMVFITIRFFFLCWLYTISLCYCGNVIAVIVWCLYRLVFYAITTIQFVFVFFFGVRTRIDFTACHTIVKTVGCWWFPDLPNRVAQKEPRMPPPRHCPAQQQSGAPKLFGRNVILCGPPDCARIARCTAPQHKLKHKHKQNTQKTRGGDPV